MRYYAALYTLAFSQRKHPHHTIQRNRCWIFHHQLESSKHPHHMIGLLHNITGYCFIDTKLITTLLSIRLLEFLTRNFQLKTKMWKINKNDLESDKCSPWKILFSHLHLQLEIPTICCIRVCWIYVGYSSFLPQLKFSYQI